MIEKLQIHSVVNQFFITYVYETSDPTLKIYNKNGTCKVLKYFKTKGIIHWDMMKTVNW